ncbi:MAG: ABC transporter substrate-binding protein [Anaerolineae bacterium]|nr:ABC transporter substrate-binding protein [Anaerolineae bacterium]
MTKKILVFLLLCALVAAVVPAVGADNTPANPNPTAPWRTECSEDLTGQTIRFFHFGDLSGTYAFISQPLVAGFTDAAAYFNENGGLCGAEIVQEYRDTGGAQEQAQAFWDEFTALDDAYVIFTYSSADGELLRQQAADKQTPLLLAAGSELALYGEDGQPGYIFATIPLYADQLAAFCDYIGENWSTMGIEGDPVIGHLSWEGAFGRSSDTEAARAHCEAAGVGYAGAEYFLPTTSDISTQLQTLLDNGANIIYTTSLASGPAQVAGTINALGLSDQLVVAGPNWVLDTSVIALGGEAAAGIMGNLPYLWWDELDQTGVQLVAGYWAQNRLANNPEEAVRVRNIAYIVSWASLDMWIEIMIQTINEVGFENLSGAAVYNTLDNFQYDALDGILRVDWTGGKRAVSTTRIGSIQFVESDAGVTPTILPLSDWLPAPDMHAASME